MQVNPYQFQSLYDPPVQEKPEEVLENLPPPPPTFSEEEMEQARNLARDEGFALGKAEGLREKDAENATLQMELREMVEKLNSGMDAFLATHRQLLDERKRQVGDLALACGQKLALEAMRLAPLVDIEATVNQCLEMLMGKPEVTLAVNPRYRAPMEERFGKLATVAGDDTLLPGDCRLVWNNGQALRSVETIWEEVEQVIHRHFSLEQPTSSQEK